MSALLASPIDLHCHSTASDGSLSPQGLIALAVERGVHTLALTDHDTTDGVAAAQAAAAEQGLKLIPGVEISVTWQQQVIHILGLNINPQQTDLQQGLMALDEQRHQRAEKIAQQLEKAGIKDALAGASVYAKGGTISRTHFAHLIVERGLARNVRKVFRHYLVRGKPGYVAGEWVSLEQALSWIHAAGGIAAVAHPVRYKMTRTRLKKLLTEFKELGGQGLEVVSGTHSRDDNFQMGMLAQHFGLWASAGSDYHGPEHFWQQLGAIPPLPDTCSPIWRHF